MNSLRVLFVQGGREPWLEAAEQEYVKKITPFCKIELRKLRPSQLERDQSDRKREEESRSIEEHLSPADFVVLCDERGKVLTSLELSTRLKSEAESGVRQFTFVLGGAFGVGESLRRRANLVLSLSKLTMNHHVARVVLLEQIYRAIMIQKNRPYHNEG